MYIPKFNYQPISRQTVEGRRLYATPDGRKIPSVTTILDKTKPHEKIKALNEWRKRVGYERAQQITTESANRGTGMHSYLERCIRDGQMPDLPGNKFNHNSWHMAQTIKNQGLINCQEFWGIEVPLYYPEIYAGTSDCVGVHNDQESIIDFKQTNKPKKKEWIDDYFLQLCAYAVAHNKLHNTDINRGVIMMCIAPLENNVPVYQEFILEGQDWKHYENLWWDRVEEYYTKFQ